MWSYRFAGIRVGFISYSFPGPKIDNLVGLDEIVAIWTGLWELGERLKKARINSVFWHWATDL